MFTDVPFEFAGSSSQQMRAMRVAPFRTFLIPPPIPCPPAFFPMLSVAPQSTGWQLEEAMQLYFASGGSEAPSDRGPSSGSAGCASSINSTHACSPASVGILLRLFCESNLPVGA